VLAIGCFWRKAAVRGLGELTFEEYWSAAAREFEP
jgi:hypothetical protein